MYRLICQKPAHFFNVCSNGLGENLFSNGYSTWDTHITELRITVDLALEINYVCVSLKWSVIEQNGKKSPDSCKMRDKYFLNENINSRIVFQLDKDSSYH